MKNEIVMMPIAQVIPYENNPRNNKEAVGKVAASLREFGFRQPIVVDKDNVIIAGHTRLLAAKKLKMKEVPVLVADDLTDEQVKAYRLADNKTAEFAEWDLDMLAEELDGILDIDMSDFGFDLGEDDEDNKPKSKVEEANVDDVPERCNPGDIWQLGRHRLMCGDSTDEETINRLIGEANVEMLLTDPPYGIKRDKGMGSFGCSPETISKYDDDWDSKAPSKQTFDMLLSKASKAIIFGGNYFTDSLPLGRSWLVWDKVGDIEFHNPYSDCELAWTNLDRNIVQKYTHIQQGFVTDEHEKRVHPTQKPVGLLVDIINEHSNKKAVILDAFGGSGSTLIACEQTGRTCFMCELSAHYCDVILARYEELTGDAPVKLENNFDDLPF